MDIPLPIRRRYSQIEYYYDSVLSRNYHSVRSYTKEVFVKRMCDGIALNYILNYKDINGDKLYIHYVPIIMEIYQERIGDVWEDLIKR